MHAEWASRNLFDVADRVVVVTGANGILGRHYVAAFAEWGARVVVADLDASACETHARELEARYSRHALGIELDVSNPTSVKTLVERVEADLGPIDVLINNAATKGRSLEQFFRDTADYDLATWKEIMSVNLDGMFLVSRDVGTRMAQRGRGSIVNVSSIYGNVGPDQRIYEGSQYLGRPINTPAVYSASKAGVIGLTRYLATLWGPHGVRVNALTPGGVESGQNDTFQSKYSARVPLGRMAKAHEMLGAVLFLASDASSYVTGHNLIVDGGWCAW